MRPSPLRVLLCIVPVIFAGVIVALAFTHGWFHLGVDLSGGTILVYEVDRNKTKDTYSGQELADALKRRVDPADLLSATIRSVGGGDRVEIVLPLRGNVNAEEINKIQKRISQQGKLEFRILANERDDKEAIDQAKELINRDPNSQELEKANLLGTKPSPPVPPGGAPWFSVRIHGEDHTYRYEWVQLGKTEVYSLHLENKSNSPMRAEALKNLGKAFVTGESSFLLYTREIPEGRRSDPTRLPPNDYKLGKKYEFFVLTRRSEPNTEVTGQFLTSATRGTDESSHWAVHFAFDAVGMSRFADVTTLNKPEGSGSQKTFYRVLAIVLDDQIESAPRLNDPITHGSGIITGGNDGFTAKQVDELVTILRAGALPATLKPQPVSENTIGATLGAETIHDGAWSVVIAFFAVLVFMLVYYRFAGLVACVALLANLLLTVAFMVIVKATFTLPGLAGLVLMLGMAVDANVLIYERLREERERGASLALALRNGYDRAFPTIIDTHLSSIFTAIVLYVVGNDQLKGFGITLTVGLIISLFTSLYMTRTMFNYWQANNWLTKLKMMQLFRRPNIPFMAIRYYFFAITVFLTIAGAAIFLARLPSPDKFQVTDTTFSSLREDKVPDSVLAKLEPLKDKEFASQSEFEKVLSEKLDKDDLNRYKDSAVRASVEPARPSVLNIDFTGGTNLTARLTEPMTITELREAFKKVNLPDLSIELSYSGDTGSAGTSTRFTIRTAEKNMREVEKAIDKALGDKLEKKLMKVVLIDRHKITAGARVTTACSFAAQARSLADLAAATATFLIPEQTGVSQVAELTFFDPKTNKPAYVSPGQVDRLISENATKTGNGSFSFTLLSEGESDKEGRSTKLLLVPGETIAGDVLKTILEETTTEFNTRTQPERLENFDAALAKKTQEIALAAILASWSAILLYLWFRFGSWTFGAAAVLCLIHDLFFTLGGIAVCYYLYDTSFGRAMGLGDFRMDLPSVAALLTLVGYSVSDTIVVFDRIREVRGKNPALTAKMINDSVNQTLSRTILSSLSVWLVVIVLYIWGGEGVHLFAFVMVIGVIVGTYSSIYIASPLLLMFGEGAPRHSDRARIQAAAAAAEA